MADLANTTTALAALLSASIASVTYALEQTRTVLRDGAPKGPVDRTLSPRVDTLEMFFEPSLTTAITRRRVLLGAHVVENDND